MASGNNHLLRKVTFEIGMASQEGAFEIQQRISNAFRSGVIRELERLFDNRSTPDLVISIDKIEIDLGHINPAHLEEEIVAALERELEQFMATVSEEVSRLAERSPGSSQKVAIRWASKSNAQLEANVVIAESSVSYFERVIRLLEYGLLPPAPVSGAAPKVAVLINEVLEKHPERLVQFLRANKGKKKIFQRLALNLEPAQLQYLAALLGCTFAGELRTYVQELLAFLEDKKISAAHLRPGDGIVFSTPEAFVWWVILVKYAGAQVPGAAIPPSAVITLPEDIPTAQSQLPEVMLVMELLLVIERLSERSVLKTTGQKAISNRTYKFSEYFQLAVRAAEAQVIAPSIKERTKLDEEIARSLSTGGRMLNDSASLAQNSLFDVPEKKNIPYSGAEQSAVEDVPEIDSGIYINNAGLIILAPYLKPFFSGLNLLDGRQFVNEETAWKAVHLLQHLCGFIRENEEEGWNESELVFNKILCGIPLEDPVPETMVLTDVEKTEAENLLKAVIANWTIMSRSSILALQTTFLQKQGRLSITGTGWELLVERDSAVEILIDKLPWGISLIRLPWNEYTIHTQW